MTSEPVVSQILYDRLFSDFAVVQRRIGFLQAQLSSKDFYRYCCAVRNEIESLDPYIKGTGFPYEKFETELEKIPNREDWQVQRRLVRLNHILECSSADEVVAVRNLLPKTMPIHTFAKNLARAYKIVSVRIHNLTYSPHFDGRTCQTITCKMEINQAINLLMSRIVLNVGQMISAPSRTQPTPAQSPNNPIINQEHGSTSRMTSEPTVSQSQYDRLLSQFVEAQRLLGALENQLLTKNFYRYCCAVRNEIESLDPFIKGTGFQYKQFEADMEEIPSWEDWQIERRRGRLFHILVNSSAEEVIAVRNLIPASMPVNTFATNLARAYSIISLEIHHLTYSIHFDGRTCEAVTHVADVNEAVNLLMSRIVINVGEMIPDPSKTPSPKKTPRPSPEITSSRDSILA